MNRICERDPMREIDGWSPAQAMKLEDIEIRESPVAFLRRQGGDGLDQGTVKIVRASLEFRDVNSKDELRKAGVQDIWGVFD